MKADLDPALPACPSWPGHLYPCLSIPRGRCQSATGAFPFPSIGPPQQGHNGASCTSSLPSTDRMRTGLWHPPGRCPELLCTDALAWFPCLHKSFKMRGDRKEGRSFFGMASRRAAGLLAMLHLSSRSILVRDLLVAMQDPHVSQTPVKWQCGRGTGTHKAS